MTDTNEPVGFTAICIIKLGDETVAEVPLSPQETLQMVGRAKLAILQADAELSRKFLGLQAIRSYVDNQIAGVDQATHALIDSVQLGPAAP